MSLQDRLIKIGNPMVKAILRSPLHGLFSKSTMLLTYTGRKSGKIFTTPVGYVQEGDTLRMISSRGHVWWRNLVGGAAVNMRLRGQDKSGWGEAIEGPEEVTSNLKSLLQKTPKYARYLKVRLSSDNQPDEKDLALAVQNWVVVKVKLG